MSYQAELNSALERHNYYRSLHGAPPLTLDQQLCQHAQQHANKGAFRHDPQELQYLKEGENLGEGYSSTAAAVDSFYQEVQNYNYNNPGFSMQTGHFTQLVWQATRHLGVGIGRDSYNGRPLYVFRYSPAGNVLGQFPSNVLPAAHAPPRSGPSPTSGGGVQQRQVTVQEGEGVYQVCARVGAKYQETMWLNNWTENPAPVLLPGQEITVVV
eukprot:GHUV01018910.1.p1 GENE.GHUV01018910.1~~GHUV01018910.1.p1  ORF type:complete len:212 (-),score=47.21 GHUV01018910.1:642-1277(-)